MLKRLMTLTILAIALAAALGACIGGGAVSLDNTDWVLTSLNGSNPLGSFTLAFIDGQAIGTSGCNSYFGDYEQTGDTLNIPMIGMTEMFCTEPEGIMDQESLYVGILSRANALSTSGTQLRLEASDGAFLVFEAVE
jgi:heat shock protein HslJ